MNMLSKAIRIAAQAHEGQSDKVGAPYILHPIRVMLQQQGEAAQIVGILHDLIEDTDWTLDRLRKEGFPEEVLTAVDCLTHRKEVSYAAYIDRIRTNLIAVRVKIADLQDNLDLARLARLGPKDIERVKKYHQYLKELSA